MTDDEIEKKALAVLMKTPSAGNGTTALDLVRAGLIAGKAERDKLVARVAELEAALVKTRDAAAVFDRSVEIVGGCGDGFCCVTGPAHGQHTNGGCRCWRDPMKAQRVMVAGRVLRMSLDRAFVKPMPILASELKESSDA